MKKLLLILFIFSCLCLLGLKNEVVNADEESVMNNDVYEILTKYYNNGVYRKDTKINLNDEGVKDLKKHFHVETTLERITYYVFDSLWMSKGIDEGSLYSYYGTQYDGETAVGVTYGTTYNYLTPPSETEVVLSGDGKNSMEEYYITLKDIKDSEVVWEKKGDLYETKDRMMLRNFLNFTAPCLYESVMDTKVFDYSKATIEVDEKGQLVLKLWVLVSDYGYVEGGESAVVDGNVVLSSALIANPDIQGEVAEYYPSISNADIVAFNGNIYTYGGNTGDRGRITNIYCYNIATNTTYDLNVKISTPSTSHRVHLYGGKVYIFGGLSNSSKRVMEIQIHDLVNQTIEVSEVPMPFGMNCQQLGYYKDKAYFAGGTSPALGNGTNKIFEIDMNTLEFTELDVTLPTITFKGAWCVVDKYLYVIGGTAGPRLDSIVRFDMEEKTVYVMNAKLPVTTSQSRAAHDGKGNIYIYGGTLEGNSLTNTIYKYNIENDTIETMPYTIPVLIANTSVVNVDGTIYIFAGDNDTNNLILSHKDDKLIELKTYFKRDIS